MIGDPSTASTFSNHGRSRRVSASTNPAQRCHAVANTTRSPRTASSPAATRHVPSPARPTAETAVPVRTSTPNFRTASTRRRPNISDNGSPGTQTSAASRWAANPSMTTFRADAIDTASTDSPSALTRITAQNRSTVSAS